MRTCKHVMTNQHSLTDVDVIVMFASLLYTVCRGVLEGVTQVYMLATFGPTRNFGERQGGEVTKTSPKYVGEIRF
jgi:hypothetical protein